MSGLAYRLAIRTHWAEALAPQARSKWIGSVGAAPARFAVMACVLVVFAYSTLSLSAQSLSLDEVDTLGFATEPLSKFLATFAGPAQNGPLYFLLMRPWVALLGDSEFVLRFPSVMGLVLLIPLTFALGRKLDGLGLGCVTAVLVAGSPFVRWYGQDAKMYTIVACLSVLSSYALHRALEPNSGRWRATYALAAITGLFTHLFFVFVLLFHAVGFVLTPPDERRDWRRVALPAGLVLAAYAPLGAWEIPAVLRGYETPLRFVSFPELLTTLVLRLSLQREDVQSLLLVAPFAVCLVMAFVARPGHAGAGLRPRFWLALYLAVPVVAFFLVSWRVPGFMARYFMIIAPAFYLAIGLGLLNTLRRDRLIGGAAIASITLLWAWSFASPGEVRPDFRKTADYVRANAQPGDGIGFIAEYAQRPFDYYFRADGLRPVPFPYSVGASPEAVASRIPQDVARAAASLRRVWLIEYEEWLWDPKAASREWLGQHGHLLAAQRFDGVSISLFEITG